MKPNRGGRGQFYLADLSIVPADFDGRPHGIRCIRVRLGVGKRAPFRGGRPSPGYGGAGSYKAASSRKRVTTVTGSGKVWHVANKSKAAYELSPTSTTARLGTHRRTCLIICWVRSVKVFGLRPRVS
jgi:hypothetical protein